MDRISTLSQQQMMLGDMMRIQREQVSLQSEVASGKRIADFAGKPDEIGGLMALRNAEMRNADFMAGAEAAKSRLAIQDTFLSGSADTIAEIRAAVFDAVATESGTVLMDRLRGMYATLQGLMNQQVEGKYVFGGTRSDVPPVIPQSLDELAALPATADAFDNNDVRPAARVDEGLTVAYGQLASDVATPVFDILRTIANFNAGPQGPFGERLTSAQRDFLTAQLQPLADAASGANTRLAENGTAQSAVEAAIERQTLARDMYKGLISNKEDADLLSAVQKLNASQIALEASARTYSSIQRMSLLDFL
jgi:flagellar hook-associated protein 3 FlgL